MKARVKLQVFAAAFVLIYLGFIIASFVPLVGLVASIAFFVIMLLPGTPGPNRYGPDPKDPASVQVFA